MELMRVNSDVVELTISPVKSLKVRHNYPPKKYCLHILISSR